MAIKLLLFVVCVWFVSDAEHEFFSSMDQIQKLVEEEKNLLDLFSLYIDAEEENLQILRGIHMILLLNTDDTEEITRDPVAAYKLIRRLRIQWLSILKSTRRSFYEDFQELLMSLKIPLQNDLDGAALGLIRLQEIYKLYPVNITKGTLSEDEAFYVGLVAFNQKKFQHAFHWFLYSLLMLNEPEALLSVRSVTEQELLHYLSTSAYRFGSLPVAIEFSQQHLNLDPTNEEVRHLLKLFKTLYRQQPRTSYPDIYTLNTESSNPYEALCRGESKQQTSSRQVALSCSYSTGGGNPRLMLAPVKEEVIWDEPRIIRYYDVLSDEEIEMLKNLSRPLLSRSKVKPNNVSINRTSQSVFLDEDDDDGVVARVNQRISDITGLSLETAEPLHVQNYGIGGRYEPHYDAWLYEKNERIATFLIYLSDVEIGGATVFPKIGIALQPIKGSAVFWHNLLMNGDVDLKTQHAACPILVGNKWVANKWFHEFGQVFTRPCSLSENE